MNCPFCGREMEEKSVTLKHRDMHGKLGMTSNTTRHTYIHKCKNCGRTYMKAFRWTEIPITDIIKGG